MQKIKGLIYKVADDVIERGLISQEDLAKLSKSLIRNDYANFDMKESVGGGFPTSLCEELIKYIPKDKGIKILLFNDITLELYNILIKNGYKNIFLAFGAWNNNISKKDTNIIDKNKHTFEIIKDYIKYSFENKVKIYRIEEIFNMGIKFNLVISNPPYAIGNEIVKNIINNIEYEKFINLMPLSCYRRESRNYIVDCHRVDNGMFEGAVTRPSISTLLKEKQNLSDTEFKLRYVVEQKLIKFYKANAQRKPTFKFIPGIKLSEISKYKSNNSVILGIRTPGVISSADGVHNVYDKAISLDIFLSDITKYKKNAEYVWNILSPELTLDQVFEQFIRGYTNKNATVFKNAIEKQNYVNWWYSAEARGNYRNSGLAGILLRGLNIDTGDFSLAIPNVDWSRPWTDEEILKDFDYSDDEIKEILHYNDDLIPTSWRDNN